MGNTIGDKLKQQENKELLAHPRVRAMLNTIAYAEGADYNTRVGGGTFSDLSRKPGKKTYIKSINNYSTAEGRYQFLNSTWNEVKDTLGLKDFSPESQDIAAIELIKRRGALKDVLDGNFNSAVTKLSKEWASLPTTSGNSAYSGQKARSIDKLKKIFASGGADSSYTPTQAKTFNNFVPSYNVAPEFKLIGSVDTNLPTINYEEDSKEEAQAKEEIKQASQASGLFENLNPQVQLAQTELPQQQPEVEVFPTIGEQYAQVSALVDNPIVQEGGELDWINNWRANRTLVPSNVRNVPLDQSTISYKPIEDVNGYPVEGVYKPKEDSITLNEKMRGSLEGTLAHESAHQWKAKIPQELSKQYISQPILDTLNASQINKYLSGTQHEQYMYDPWEIHGEVMRARYLEGYKPEQKINVQDIQNIKNRDTYNFGDLSDEQLMNIFNSTADVGTNTTNRYAQEGGRYYGEGAINNWWNSLSFDDKDAAVIKTDADFIHNWYKNRKQILNEKGQRVKVNPINLGIHPDVIKEDISAEGVYNTDRNTLTLDPSFKDYNNVYTHEMNHKYQTQIPKNKVQDYFYRGIAKNNPNDNLYKPMSKDTKSYLNDPKEVHSRLMQFRQMNGLDPKKFYTPADVRKMSGQYELDLHEIPVDKLTNMLNMTVYNENANNNTYAQEGGIPVSSRGVYDYPMQEVIVPTKDGSITMNGVPYPILGIDEFGNQQMMYPNQQYKFKGNTIHEIPQLKNYFNKR